MKKNEIWRESGYTNSCVCEIITTGNELLIGKTLNTNGYWLAKSITSLGGKVARAAVIGDDVADISSAIKEAMKRKSNFIITVGGLGPTFDDKTLEGVAKALDRSLKVNKEAKKMLEEKYRKFVEAGQMERVELTPPRVKMARLPQGSKILFNPVGTAPGVLIKSGSQTIISLPGVPSEMKAIFQQSVIPILRKASAKAAFFDTSIGVTGIGESLIVPLINKVMRDNPDVYLKSHPKDAQGDFQLELHISITAENPKVARKKVNEALIQLSEIIRENDGKISYLQSKAST